MKELDNLIEIATWYLNVPKGDILKKTTERKITLTRHIISYLAVKFNYASQSELARLFKQDRATIHYAIKNFEGNMQFNKPLQKDINAITNLVYQKDKSLVLKNALQLAPPKVLPRLVEKIEEWIKDIEVTIEEVPESTPENNYTLEPT